MKSWWKAITLTTTLTVSIGAVAQPSAAAPRSVKSEGWTVTWQDSSARARGPKGQKIALYTRPKQSCSELTGTVVSVVGTFVSTYSAIHEYCSPKAAHPGHRTSFEVVDLARGGQKVSLTEIFSEAELLSGLLGDPFIRESLKGREESGKTATSLEELYAQLFGECDFYLGESTLTSFAFYELKGNKVAVRIGMSHSCEAARGEFTQLGVYLPVPNWLLPKLKTAQRAGTLMQTLKLQPGLGR